MQTLDAGYQHLEVARETEYSHAKLITSVPLGAVKWLFVRRNVLEYEQRIAFPDYVGVFERET